MPDRQVVIDRLAALGLGHIANFNQADEHRKGKRGSIVKGGYCYGVCLDWARRILQGGRLSFGPRPGKEGEQEYDYHGRRQEQAKRQQYAWASFYSNQERNGTATKADFVQSGKDYNTAWDNFIAEKTQVHAVAKKLGADWNKNNHLGESHVVQISYGTDLVKVFPTLRPDARTAMSVKALRNLFDEAEKRLKTLVAPVKAGPPNQAALDQRTWAAFSAQMEDKLPKKRSFEKVSLICLHPSKSYGSVGEMAAAVTDPPPDDFCAGRVMIVGVKFKKTTGDGGHAVAVYWRPAGRFILLDPNYGMFVYEDLSGPRSVAAALGYLIGTVFPDMEGVQQVLNDVDYGIFANRDE